MNPSQLKLIQDIFLDQDGRALSAMEVDIRQLIQSVRLADIRIGTEAEGGAKTEEFKRRKNEAMDNFENGGLKASITNIRQAREKLKGMSPAQLQEMMHKLNIMLGMPAPRPPPGGGGEGVKGDWPKKPATEDSDDESTSASDDERDNGT